MFSILENNLWDYLNKKQQVAKLPRSPNIPNIHWAAGMEF